jgi:hypothetical protein
MQSHFSRYKSIAAIVAGIYCSITLLTSCETHHACMAVSNNGKTSYYTNQRNREAKRIKKEFDKNNPTGMKSSGSDDQNPDAGFTKEKKHSSKGKYNQPILQ